MAGAVAPVNAEEPPPTPRLDLTATWDLIILDMEQREPEPELKAAVLADMRERDAIGTAKYNVRHTAFNGRDHLVDAYQEALDLAVYLRAEMEERGITTKSPCPRWEDAEVKHCYSEALSTIIRLRRIMRHRG